ncbi:MAG: ribonuclease R [Clostridia bacterium]|nr:ribonuclease R [Clostridia bacterium]
MGYLSYTKLLSLFKDGTLYGKSFSAVLNYFAKSGVGRNIVSEMTDELVLKGELIKKDGRFYPADMPKGAFPEKPVRFEMKTGAFRCNEKGFGFVTVEGDKDYYIRAENMGQALNGDTVEIRLLGGKFGDLAEIVKVVERGATKITGTVFSEGGLIYVRPDDKAYFADIFIDTRSKSGAEAGEESHFKTAFDAIGKKVLVEITSFPKNRCPEGKISKVIGNRFELETEETSLVLLKGVETEFSEDVLKESSAAAHSVDDRDLEKRRDLRGDIVFTIDGESAKDFDDAVSLKIEGDKYVLGVHIADVSHYVKENGALDKSAFARGTSVYLPDKVIPMLPFELSNGICSLNQGVDRLTVSVVVTIDKEGNVSDTEIFKSVIKSRYRLTYTLVDKLLEGDEKLGNEYNDIADIIQKMNGLRCLLERRRKKAGYIDLDVKESDIFLENGNILVSAHRSTPATRLIEQFMITANEAVASYLYYQNLPCVYRIHEKPTQEKTEQLKSFLKVLGMNVSWRKDGCHPKDIRKLLKDCEGKDYFAVVNKTVLRSMQKAKYSAINLGHFGLASDCYCHFTSPIRRYPDLLVHRALKRTLDGQITSFIDLYEDFFIKAAENSSKTERVAEDLERAVDDLYKTQFMSDKVGNEYDGIVSSVVSSGFFVELENTCEGFVPIELLPAGTYTFDKENMCLSTYRRTYKVGDRVKICVVSADIASRKVDFCLAKNDRNAPIDRKKRRPRAK